MQTLDVIGVEDDAILVVAPSGERFRVPVDAALRTRLREKPDGGPVRRLSPREIQTHVRAGLSPQQVAALAGASVADVERFVGPVLAERAHVLETALRVRVRTEDGAEPRRFADVMDERLGALSATAIAWTTLKEAGGPWVVALRFEADGLQHDARWSVDLKRQTLAPENIEAATLSQQGTPLGLTPRLQAVPATGPVAVVATAEAQEAPEPPEPVVEPEPDRSRFDSAVFRLPDLAPADERRKPESTADLVAALAAKRGEDVAPDAADGPIAIVEPARPDAEDDAPAAVDAPRTSGRLTRGRFPEHLPGDVEPVVADPPAPRRRARPVRRPSSPAAPVPPVDDDDDGTTPRARPVPVPQPGEPAVVRPNRRTGRTSMPSWDEIVFGRDDD